MSVFYILIRSTNDIPVKDTTMHNPPASLHTTKISNNLAGSVNTQKSLPLIRRNRQRGLPHWDLDSGTYFVTFRLADSLPRDVLVPILRKKDDLIAKLSITERNDSRKLALIEGLTNRNIEKALDEGHGACTLNEPKLAGIVMHALLYFNNERYRLYAGCVMPNHVHVVLRLFSGTRLTKVAHSWKSYTANEINKVLGRSGKVWQRDYFDRLLLKEKSFLSALTYVVNNPLKAGLENWDWVWVEGEDG
jgi:putative DNA methylase